MQNHTCYVAQFLLQNSMDVPDDPAALLALFTMQFRRFCAFRSGTETHVALISTSLDCGMTQKCIVLQPPSVSSAGTCGQYKDTVCLLACRYVDYRLDALRRRELFMWLELQPATFWHTLLFRYPNLRQSTPSSHSAFACLILVCAKRLEPDACAVPHILSQHFPDSSCHSFRCTACNQPTHHHLWLCSKTRQISQWLYLSKTAVCLYNIFPLSGRQRLPLHATQSCARKHFSPLSSACLFTASAAKPHGLGFEWLFRDWYNFLGIQATLPADLRDQLTQAPGTLSQVHFRTWKSLLRGHCSDPAVHSVAKLSTEQV